MGTILLVVAGVLFGLRAFGVKSDRFDLVAGGLLACVLSVLLPAL